MKCILFTILLCMLFVSLPINAEWITVPGGGTGSILAPDSGSSTFSTFFSAGKTINCAVYSLCSRSSVTVSMYVSPNDYETEQEVVNLRPKQSYFRIFNCNELAPINWGVLISAFFNVERYDPNVLCQVDVTWASYTEEI